MLANGFSYSYILRALDARHRVTIDSIRNHCVRHFPVQNIARATYRDILERRAKENGVDFVEGVATAITPMALYETIMVKGYQTLVDPDTKIDVNTAMIAAGRLQSLIDTRAGQPDIVDMLVQMNRIISAVKSTVPESMWPGIARKLKGEDEASEPQQLACEDFHSWYQDADPGALPTLRAAIDLAVRGDQYFGPDGSQEIRGYPKVVASSAQSHDIELQRRLWAVSEELTGVISPIG
jgi:hypothetical protein